LQFALAGANTVIISGRNTAPLEKAKSLIQAAAPSCTVLPISGDAIDEVSVQQLFDSLPRTPDVLINNAGVSLSQKSIVDSDASLWWSDWVSPIHPQARTTIWDGGDFMINSLRNFVGNER